MVQIDRRAEKNNMSPEPEGGGGGGGGGGGERHKNFVKYKCVNMLNNCMHESMIIVKHLSLCVSNILV